MWCGGLKLRVCYRCAAGAAALLRTCAVGTLAVAVGKRFCLGQAPAPHELPPLSSPRLASFEALVCGSCLTSPTYKYKRPPRVRSLCTASSWVYLFNPSTTASRTDSIGTPSLQAHKPSNLPLLFLLQLALAASTSHLASPRPPSDPSTWEQDRPLRDRPHFASVYGDEPTARGRRPCQQLGYEASYYGCHIAAFACAVVALRLCRWLNSPYYLPTSTSLRRNPRHARPKNGQLVHPKP